MASLAGGLFKGLADNVVVASKAGAKLVTPDPDALYGHATGVSA